VHFELEKTNVYDDIFDVFVIFIAHNYLESNLLTYVSR